MKKTKGEKIFAVFNIFIMILLLCVTLYPMLHVVFGSISDPKRLLAHSGAILYPLGIDLNAYAVVFSSKNIFTGYFNTIFYTVAGSALSMMLTVLGAYALARKGVMLGKYIMLGVVFTMFFSGGMIPSYLLVKDLGLLDTRAAIIVPTAISTWNLIVLRTAFKGVPENLFESAALDGANDFIIMFRIALPLVMSTIAVIILFYGVERWNEWFSASIYLRNRSKYPLQLFLREILIASQVNETVKSSPLSLDTDLYRESIKYATILVSILPILCVYPFLQKYFVHGVMIGAVKG